MRAYLQQLRQELGARLCERVFLIPNAPASKVLHIVINGLEITCIKNLSVQKSDSEYYNTEKFYLGPV